MKKNNLLLLSIMLITSFSVLSETNNIIKNEQCVLIKEIKLTDYLPEEDVNNFLENRFIDKIETQNINYSIQEVNRKVNRRIKTYKVCAEYKEN